MKLINPQQMTARQERAYELCLAQSRRTLDRGELLATLGKQIDSIESGISVLGRGLPIPHLGRIDLVAEDSNGRIVLVSYQERVDDQALCAALRRADWVCEHAELIGHIYERMLTQDDVRVWQLGVSIASSVDALMRRMASGEAELFTCEGMELARRRWLVVKRYHLQERSSSATRSDVDQAELVQAPKVSPLPPSPHKVRSDPKKGEGMHSVLTKQEIDDFFSPSAASNHPIEEDETTYSGPFEGISIGS